MGSILAKNSDDYIQSKRGIDYDIIKIYTKNTKRTLLNKNKQNKNNQSNFYNAN